MDDHDIIDPALLISAYAQGVFPMSDGVDDPSVHWVEPRLRAILPLDALHVSRSLKKLIQSDRISVTTDQCFAEMMTLCAAPADDRPSTWINPVIKASYAELFAMGYAHSVECWQDGALVGGLYGVSLGRAFFGESMVSRVPSASKVALAHLVARLKVGGWQLLDCQFMTPHLESMGAVEIPQSRYLKLLYSVLSGAADGAVTGAEASAADGAAGASALPSPPFAAGDWRALDALTADFSAGGVMAAPPGYVIAQLLTNTS
jgi:leucyl/phenylalanyl-tRNA--protein transferase